MHWTQIAYALILCTALASAFWRGQNSWLLMAVMSVNFVATYELSDSFVDVSIVDLMCAACLLGRSQVASMVALLFALMVALLFALMVPVYLAAWALQWQNSTTYAIVDVLAYLQCALIGGIGGGFVNRYSDFIDRLGYNLGIVQIRVHAENYISSTFRKAG